MHDEFGYEDFKTMQAARDSITVTHTKKTVKLET